jgi:hypothetical protein
VPAETSLTQGDLICDCPLLVWEGAAPPTAPAPSSEPALKEMIRAFREDVVVMSQACELEHDQVQNVVRCPHVSPETFRAVWQEWMTARHPIPSEKAWKRACEDMPTATSGIRPS